MKRFLQILLILLPFTAPSAVFAEAPYIIPYVRGLETFQNRVYIDPTGPNGNGTIESPHNTIQDLNLEPGTAYLIKSATTLNEQLDKVWQNNYVGTYGGEERAVINGGIVIRQGSNGLVVNYLRIEFMIPNNASSGSIVRVISSGGLPRNIAFSNCYILGIHNPERSVEAWPRNAFSGSADGVTIYNNVIGDVGSQIFFFHAHNYRLVRNYIFNANRNAWNGEDYDESTGTGNGTGWSMRYYRENAYVAGNLFDIARDFTIRPDTYWKSTFAIRAGWDHPPANMVIEYNTIVSPPRDLAGNGVLHHDPPKQTIVRYNVIDGSMQGRSRGKTPVVGSRFEEHLSQPAPYGIRDNHLIRHDPGEPVIWPTGQSATLVSLNVVYNTFDDYLGDVDREPWGSDIDPDDFWGSHPGEPPPFEDDNVEDGIWYGFAVDDLGYTDTHNWLGQIWVPHHPWIWHSGWNSYLFKGHDSNWFFLPGPGLPSTD